MDPIAPQIVIDDETAPWPWVVDGAGDAATACPGSLPGPGRWTLIWKLYPDILLIHGTKNTYRYLRM